MPSNSIMDNNVAVQIADLLNAQNNLMNSYDAATVLNHADRYIVKLGENQKVLGCIEVKKVQWYQFEIDHLSVHPEEKRKGLGTALLTEAEARARQLGARIAQCTIRLGNTASEKLFNKNGYTKTVTFKNSQNGNQIAVYQKVLS